MPTWPELLNDYAATVASLEHRLEEDVWAQDVPPFEVPQQLPTEAPTAADLQRFQELERRAAELNGRLQTELNLIRTDLSKLDTRRDAAREYGNH